MIPKYIGTICEQDFADENGIKYYSLYIVLIYDNNPKPYYTRIYFKDIVPENFVESHYHSADIETIEDMYRFVEEIGSIPLSDIDDIKKTILNIVNPQNTMVSYKELLP